MCSKSYSWRYIVVGITFASTLSITAMRYCFSLTLTQMVETAPVKAALDIQHDHYSCPIYSKSIHKNETLDTNQYETVNTVRYEWSQELQGMILSSFYLGYAISHFPGGILADRFGGKAVIATALISTVFITLSIPIVVDFGGATALITLRLIMGLLQGGIFPAINAMISAWVPQHERSRMVSLVFCGYPLGSTIANFFSGILLQHYDNWHMVFYHFGFIGVFTSILFITFCSSSPYSHPFISNDEKNYLKKEIGQLKKKHNGNLPPTPWKSILSSKPIITLIITSFLGDWTYYVLLVDLPKYMNDVLHVSVKENGFYSSLPWLMFVLISLSSSYWSDWLISSGRLSITRTRKLFVFVSSIIDASFVMAAAYGGCDPAIVGLFFTISVGATGLQTSGIFVNSIDLSPNYSGTISGLSSTFGALSGVLGPALVGFLTPNSLQSEWRIVFWINFCMHIVKLILFLIWGSARVQPWNSPVNQLPINLDSQTENTENEDHLKR